MEREKKQQEIDIYCMLRDVFHDLWVAVIVGISAAFLAYIGARLAYQPTYTSRTTFVVSSRNGSTGAYANLSKTQKLTEVFQSVMDSNVLKKKVSDGLGMDEFEGTVEIMVVPETNLLTVYVTSDSPETALKLLRGMLEYYPEVGKNVLGDVVLEVFEEPGYPAAPDEAFHGKDIMQKAFLVGAAVMLAMLAVLSAFRDTVKNEEEVAQKLDTTTLGVLCHEKKYRNVKDFLRRKKKRIMLTEPSVSFGYAEAMKKLRMKLLYQMRYENVRIIMITSAAPREGKTTLAVNLAHLMAKQSRKVLLIEGDIRNCDLMRRLQLDPGQTADWGKCLAEGDELEAAITCPENCAYRVMVNQTKIIRSTELLASERMGEFLAEMRQKMDLIIIDAPPAGGRSDTEVLAKYADASLLVVRQNMTLAKYINDSIDMLDSYGKGLLGCVYNDVVSGGGILVSGYGSGYGYGYGYGYGRYGRYGKYGKYGAYDGYGKYDSLQRQADKKESRNEQTK